MFLSATMSQSKHLWKFLGTGTSFKISALCFHAPSFHFLSIILSKQQYFPLTFGSYCVYLTYHSQQLYHGCCCPNSCCHNYADLYRFPFLPLPDCLMIYEIQAYKHEIYFGHACHLVILKQ